ncbi:MAG: thioredoxin domain-containing protein [bacterium]
MSRCGVILIVMLLIPVASCGDHHTNEEPGVEPKLNETVNHQSSRPTNRLAREQSPYLLQHAYNPVDWYPWGEEAFARAEREDKPIFLSIGYSTCHWCHVMERESFEDHQVATLLNEAFVCIKVDREERPDIDNVYMSACQMMTGSGGWPLTVVLTPARAPFFAATYIPKRERFGRKGMLELIPELQRLWRDDRQRLLSAADQVTSALARSTATASDEELTADLLDQGYERLAQAFDNTHGGFGNQTKFPTPHQLVFLLRYWFRTGQPHALEMATRTLRAMRLGGIYDHVGFGFHRYSTEPTWLVPHFEKMLYDQAMLLWAYAEAYQATGEELFARTAREIVEYVSRDLTSPEGGFYSAEDADSEGIEGKFYLWSEEDIRSLLHVDSADLVINRFGVTAKGNFHEGGAPPGSNILHIRRKGDFELDEKRAAGLEQARQKLLASRGERIRPLLDDKVLTDWNGLMIGALAIAARALGEPEFTAAARRAAEFIFTRLSREDGRLLHRYRGGEAGIDGQLEDYAFLTFGLIELYQTTYDPVYLERALELNRLQIEHFAAEAGGGFHLTPDDGEQLLVRAVEYYDGAIPSGNSLSFSNLLRLARLTGQVELEEYAATVGSGFGRDVARMPHGHAMFLVGLDFAVGPSLEVVIAGEPDAADTRAMLDSLDDSYTPRMVVLLRDDTRVADLVRLAPFVQAQTMQDAAATAYVCVDHACAYPTTEPAKMRELIQERLAQPGSH